MAALALVGACAGDRDPPAGEPRFYRSLAVTGAELDAASAASMISGYRANNGLPAVTIDPELMKLADAQARAMASRDKLDHRSRATSTPASRAPATARAPRPRTFRPATTRWRRHSPAGATPHRTGRTCCSTVATRMGIAAVYAPKSKYKVFWALILAQPDERRAGAQ